jgi:hypothetical protein
MYSKVMPENGIAHRQAIVCHKARRKGMASHVMHSMTKGEHLIYRSPVSA